MARSVGLDREAVVQAAAALADAVGVEQLTLAQLAAQLGIRTPSLYNYIDGLPGLRRDLALFGYQQIIGRLSRAAIGKAADDAVMAIARAYRDYAKEHPGLYAATLAAPDPQDAGLQAAGQEVVELVLAVLAPYGLREEDALHAVRGLRSIVHGFATLEAVGGFGLPLDLDESFRRLIQMFIDGLHNARHG